MLPGPDLTALDCCTQIAALEVTADTAAKERDFYFGKLRDIEVMCQTPGLQNSKVPLRRRILRKVATNNSAVSRGR